jgi:transcriptional regulator of acetoin/glycerol metabolism
MAHNNQLQLLDWSARTQGRIQIVSMTSVPLIPRVQMGAFLGTLYYRLNTVCVDVTA